MPRIIRKALYLKLRELPELRDFQRDFELMSRMKLVFVDDLGADEGSPPETPPMCATLKDSGAGCAMCARTRQALLARTTDQAMSARCDAGLNECAVPVNISGIKAGYFLFFGYATSSPGSASTQKIRHLLNHGNIELETADIGALLSQSVVVPDEVVGAIQRMVQRAVKQIGLRITDQLAEAETAMPPAVTKACRFIRARALADDLSLPVVARQCGTSAGHLSRIFHRATGLTFREYLTQVRVEHARALLMSSGRSVTEIAFESGFQSLSQFHRVFLKVYGVPPGRLRAARRPQEVGTGG